MYSVKELAPCPEGLVLFFYLHPNGPFRMASAPRPGCGTTAREACMDMLILIVGSSLTLVGCIIALWMMP